MSKKLIVMLFPVFDFIGNQEEYLQEITDSNIKVSDIFDTIIEKRYLDNNYEFSIATYIDRPIYGVSTNPTKVSQSSAKYDEFYKRSLDEIMADYNYMATQLKPEEYDEIVVGGYHIGDCVDKFTKAIKDNTNAKVSIDYELSNVFIQCGILNKDGTLNEAYEFYGEIISRVSKNNIHK